MDIVIPYRNDCNNGAELRFALRSIEANLFGYDKIIIVGDTFPTWIKNVEKIIFFEESLKSPRNILNKIVHAFRFTRQTKIVQWQDDIYLTRPMDVKDIDYWYYGTLQSMVDKSVGRYRTIVKNTIELIGPEEKYYDIHVPMVYNIDSLIDISIKYDWTKKEYLLKSVYCKNINGTEMCDNKLQPNEPEEIIFEKLRNNLFFSTGPYSFNDCVINILKSKFSKKSKWEV